MKERMKIQGFRRAIIAAAVAIASVPAFATPTFTNGSFESGMSGWTEISPFLGVQNWSSLGGLSAQDGANAYWMGATDDNGANHIGQSINGFTVGNSYTLNFAMVPERGANFGRPGAFLLVDMTGSNVSSSRFSALASDPSCNDFFACAPGWQSQSLTFTANSSTINFDFHADVITSQSWEIGLDNFRLTDNGVGATVPEPTSIALFCLGILGFAANRRSKPR